MRSGTLIYALILMITGIGFSGSAPVTEYVTINAKLEQTGTGEFIQLFMIDKNDNRYLVETPYPEKLKKLTGISLLISGKLQRVKETLYQGKFNIDAYNTIPVRELAGDDEVAVMGVLKRIEGDYYLLTSSQVILSLKLSATSLLTDFTDQEVLVKGNVSLDSKYKGEMEVFSYSLLEEQGNYNNS